MGWIKATYRVKMRFFNDSDREVWVRWYFVPETHDKFPAYHRFHTGDYADARIKDWPGLGEVKGTKEYGRFSNVWRHQGKQDCFRGTVEQFANGMSVNDPPPVVPHCCLVNALFVGEGGVEQGGQAVQLAGYFQPGVGGQAQGGAADQFPDPCNGHYFPGLRQHGFNEFWEDASFKVAWVDGDCLDCLGNTATYTGFHIRDLADWQNTDCEAPVVFHLATVPDCYAMYANDVEGALVHVDHSCHSLVYHFKTDTGGFCNHTGATGVAEMIVVVSALCDASGAWWQLGRGGQEQGGRGGQGGGQTGGGGQWQGGEGLQLRLDQTGGGGQQQGGEGNQMLIAQVGSGGQEQGGQGIQATGSSQFGAGGQEQGGAGGQEYTPAQVGQGGQEQGGSGSQTGP